MPSFEKVSDATLERRKAAIEAEQKKRAQERGGQNLREFETLHSDADCELETHFLGFTRSGFYDSDLVEASAYVYVSKCKKHGSKSSRFNEMGWIEGAIDMRKIG